MKTIHLLAAAISLLMFYGALQKGVSYAKDLEWEYVHVMAPLRPSIKTTGSAFQRAAFEQPDLLPLYGASESFNQSSEFQADQFFKDYPTGFAPYNMAHTAAGFIDYVQAVAGIGADLNGKKVVISFTPSQIYNGRMVRQEYAANFSRLHANELIFSTQLTDDIKRQAAVRMLQYPNTLESDPLLKFALEQLVGDAPYAHLLFDLSFPLGRLQTWIMELQDHFEAVHYILSLKNIHADVPHHTTAINWAAQEEKAKREQIMFSLNNTFGFDSAVWRGLEKHFVPKKPPAGDALYLQTLNSSTEWTDLELLLKTLHELGAKPLLLGRPTNDTYFHAIGVSNAALQTYYDRLDQIAKAYGVPVVDFQNLRTDLYFGIDPSPHTSREGWVHVDQALDAFYHGTVH